MQWISNKTPGLGLPVTLIIFTVIIFVTLRQTKATSATSYWLTHTHEVLFRSETMLSVINEAEMSSKAYVTTSQPYFLKAYELSKTRLLTISDTLRRLTSDNPSQQARFNDLSKLISRRIDYSNPLHKNAVLNPDTDQYLEHVGKIIGEIKNEENRLLKVRKQASRNAELLEYITFFSIILLVIGLVLHQFWKEKQLAAKLKRESDIMFTSLLESAPDSMIITSSDGTILQLNTETESLFGYKPDELIGSPLKVLLPAGMQYAHVDSRGAHFLGAKMRITKSGPELFGMKKDGSRFPVEISFSPLTTAGGSFVSASIRDITYQKKAEETVRTAKEYFQMVVTSVKDYAIFMLDKEGNVATWNSGAENIKGYREDEIIGKPMSLFYLDEEVEQGVPNQILKMTRENGHYTTDGLRKRKDGSTFYANITYTSLYDEEGELYGYLKVTKDITEKRAAEDRIRFLATIADNIQDPIICTDREYHITQWNDAAQKLLGWQQAEVIGRVSSEVLNYKYPFQQRESIIKFLTEHGYWQGEVTYHTKLGKPLDVLLTASFLKDSAGNIIGHLTLARDITERKQAETALKKLNDELEIRVAERTEELYKSEKKYRYLFENNPLPMWVIDLKTFRFLDVNEMATVQYGFSREEFLSMTALDIRPQEEKELFIQADHGFNSPSTSFNRGTWNHQKKDGTIIQVEITGHKIWYGGVQARFILSNDVTERSKAEKKLAASELLYRNLFENMLNGFAYCKGIFDNDQLTDYTYLTVNNEYEKLTGLTQIAGKRISEVMPGLLHSDPVYVETVTRVALSGNPARLETYVKHLDKWFSISLYSPAKEYFVSLLDNITERKKAEQKIKMINVELEERVSVRTEQLKKSNKELESFSYSVSHDLRAPLRIIDGFGQILIEDYFDKLDEEGQHTLEVIMNSAKKMGQLIDDLLNFSKLGRAEMRLSDIDMNMLVKEVLRELKIGGIVIPENFIVKKLDPAYGDNNLLKQVWVNLISNAIKYSGKKDQPAIEIGMGIKDSRHVYYIKDNGVGFDMKYADKLFGVFQRLHRDAEFVGTGVGLALVQRIILRHEGLIWSEAEEGKGATFYFMLPKTEIFQI